MPEIAAYRLAWKNLIRKVAGILTGRAKAPAKAGPPGLFVSSLTVNFSPLNTYETLYRNSYNVASQYPIGNAIE